MPIPAISYARVSSERQLRGEGLKRQIKGAADWIAAHPEHELRLDLNLTDAARSAWKGDHLSSDGALGKLLEMVDRGEIRPGTWLLVEALDRLSRENPWKANHQLSGLVTKGITVVTTKDGKIYSQQSNLGDLILSIVLMASAHEESENKSGRVRDTKAQRVAEAMATKYVLHQNTPGWIRVTESASAYNRATRTYELIQHHAETVQRIFQMALDHGAAYITRHLVENNIESFGRSGKWNVRYVKNILASRAPLGHLETRHGVIEDTFPKIISDNLWLQVQAACKARKGSGGAKIGGTVNLLAGIARCAECGGNLRINRHGRTRHQYYECTNHAVLRTCPNKARYRVDIIESALLADLGWLTVVRNGKGPASELSSLEAKLATLRGREQRLAGRLKTLDDDEMFDVVLTQLRELRREVADAAAELSALKQREAVAAAPVVINDLKERDKLATALRQLLKGAFFDVEAEVGVLSKGGLLLMITARQSGPQPRLLMLRTDGKVALIQEGKMTVTDAPPDLVNSGMTALDWNTIADLRAAMGIAQPENA